MGASADQELHHPSNSTAVMAHLQILQSVIQRMAANSASCKAWCVAIVSAMLVLMADKGRPFLAALGLFPALLFLTLDAYYLALEKAYRATYVAFVRKLHQDRVHVDELYLVIPKGDMSRHQIDALLSFSVWGFYGMLVVLVILTAALIS